MFCPMRYQVKLEVHCYAAQLLWFRLPIHGVLLRSYTFVNICFKLPCFPDLICFKPLNIALCYAFSCLKA